MDYLVCFELSTVRLVFAMVDTIIKYIFIVWKLSVLNSVLLQYWTFDPHVTLTSYLAINCIFTMKLLNQPQNNVHINETLTDGKTNTHDLLRTTLSLPSLLPLATTNGINYKYAMTACAHSPTTRARKTDIINSLPNMTEHTKWWHIFANITAGTKPDTHTHTDTTSSPRSVARMHMFRTIIKCKATIIGQLTPSGIRVRIRQHCPCRWWTKLTLLLLLLLLHWLCGERISF